MSQLLRDILLRLSQNVIGGFVCQSHLVSVSPQCVAKSAFYPDQSLLPSQLLVSLAENQLPGPEAVTDFLQVVSRSEVVIRKRRKGEDRYIRALCVIIKHFL